MGALAFLAALLGSAAVGLMLSGDDDAIDEVDEPVDPEPEPPVDAVTGATFDFDSEAGTVNIDVGDDETGSLFAILVEGEGVTVEGGSGAGSAIHYDLHLYIGPPRSGLPA